MAGCLLCSTLTEMAIFKQRPVPRSTWCLVGNVAEPTTHGEQRGKNRTTKHFRPLAKVYCLPHQWHDGYESIKVIGRHRGSNQFVTLVIPASQVTNWRAKVVYSPEILRRLAEHGNYQWESRQEVEEMVVVLQTRERLGEGCTSEDIEGALTHFRKQTDPGGDSTGS